MTSRERTTRTDPETEIDDWLKVVDRLPFISSMKRDITNLRRLLYDRRAPRIATVGMPGSGRTALANAMLTARTFGEGGAAPSPEPGRWVHIDADGRRLDWLELPADLPVDALLEMARRAFEERPPDVLVGVVEAGAEKSAGPRVSAALAALTEHLSTHHHQKTARVVVVSKMDLVGPLVASAEERQPAVDHALDEARKALSELGLAGEAFIPVVGEPPEGAPRWNVDALGEALLDRLPEAAQLEAARAFEVGRDARRRVGRALVNSASALALTVGLTPIPFADAFVLLPLQAAMVTGVAYLSGRPWDRKAAAEWLASVGVVGGAGFGLRWGAQQLAKLVPGAGTVVGAGVAGAGTLAIGRSALAYFIDGPGGAKKRLELRADNA